MPKLSFYDVKGKEKFDSDKYEVSKKIKGSRTTYFAIANAPSGIKAYRIISKDLYNQLK